jgi:hypothetical protein
MEAGTSGSGNVVKAKERHFSIDGTVLDPDSE